MNPLETTASQFDCKKRTGETHTVAFQLIHNGGSLHRMTSFLKTCRSMQWGKLMSSVDHTLVISIQLPACDWISDWIRDPYDVSGVVAIVFVARGRRCQRLKRNEKHACRGECRSMLYV